MRYMVFVKMREDVGAPPPELIEAMGRSMGDAMASGLIVEAGGLGPTSGSTEVRLTAGQVRVIDGPFAEAKEVVGGYSVLEVNSHEEAVQAAQEVIEIHRQHWPGWEGTVEVRPVFGAEPPAPQG